ncbi:MAG: DsrE family protein [Actinomycetota bacterium]|nr:DsrE family protein [Actinomycetota bacterium]
MEQKVLSIIGTAYRATIEEQDDTVLWLTHMLKTAGLDIAVLLRANAVNYAVRGQDASGLQFGKLEVLHPPTLDADLAALLDHNVPVYYVADDALTRGIAATTVIDGVQPVPADDLPSLFERYEQVWLW